MIATGTVAKEGLRKLRAVMIGEHGVVFWRAKSTTWSKTTSTLGPLRFRAAQNSNWVMECQQLA